MDNSQTQIVETNNVASNNNVMSDADIDNFFQGEEKTGENQNIADNNQLSAQNDDIETNNNQQSQSSLTDEEINYFVDLLNQVKNNQTEVDANFSQKDIEINNAQVLLKNMQDVSNTIQSGDLNLETIAIQTKLDVEAMKLENEILKNRQAWNEVEMKYPEIRNNVDLDNLVYSYYKEQKARGNRITPMQAAEAVMGFFNSMIQQKTSDIQKKAEEELQKRMFGSVKTNTGSSFNNDILSKIKQGDEEAINDFFRSI